MVSYYCPIVPLCLKCTVFEIWRHIGRKSPEKPTPPSFGIFLWGDPLRIFGRVIPCQKLESWAYQRVYISRSCFRCARHSTGVWQTDVWTDGQTDTSLLQRPRYHSVAQVKMFLLVHHQKYQHYWCAINWILVMDILYVTAACLLQLSVTESVALLYVSYQSPDGGRVTPRIQLSSLLEQYVIQQSVGGAVVASLCVIISVIIIIIIWPTSTKLVGINIEVRKM